MQDNYLKADELDAVMTQMFLQLQALVDNEPTQQIDLLMTQPWNRQVIDNVAQKTSFRTFKPITETSHYDKISAFRLGNKKFIKKQSQF